MTARSDAAPRDRLLVGIAFGLMVLHTLDEAFVHPEDGGGLNLTTSLVVAAVVLALLPRMHRWVRVGVFGFFGLQGVLAGAGGHVVHLVRGDAAPLDWSGILFVLGGGLLLVLAVAEARPRQAAVAADVEAVPSSRSVPHD
jgi:hypothetical protein